ncbi:hypothetical protein GBS0709_27860 [Edwardsiella tarda]|nr:hypothetical protein GBS0709_27860 [Edwardsiella tarda]
MPVQSKKTGTEVLTVYTVKLSHTLASGLGSLKRHPDAPDDTEILLTAQSPSGVMI